MSYAPPVNTAPGQPNGGSLFEQWPETSQLSREDMEALLHDDQYFDAFFNTLPRVKAYHDAVDNLLHANEEVTAGNNAQRPQLEQLRSETANAFNEANNLKARWAQLDMEQAQAYRRFEPQQQLARLRYAVSDQDKLSDHVAADFQNGQVDDDQALARYREMRRVFHRRALQSDLWSQGKIKW